MQAKVLITLALSTQLLAAECRAHGGFIPLTPPIDAPGGPAPHGPPPTPAPAPSAPTAPLSPGAATGGREGGSAPSTPSTPKTGGPATGFAPQPTTPTRPNFPTTGGAMASIGAIDPTGWESWWGFNQDRYLDLKTHIAALEVSTSGDGAWLSSGASAYGADAASEIVVPALLALLEQERQQDIVTSVTIALARMADGTIEARGPEFSRAFAAFVNDPNQEIAETSVLARGIVGDESAVQELTALLADAESARRLSGGKPVSTRTRAFAGYALGLLAAQSTNEDVRRFIVHHLASALQTDAGHSPDVHVSCVLALGLAPLSWSEKLGGDLAAPTTIAAARKISSVATASRETQLETLFAYFVGDKGDRFVRAQIPTTLAKLANGASHAACAEITDALLATLAPNAQERDEVVQGAVLALGRIDGVELRDLDKRVRATLQRTASGGERQARSFALIALAQRASRTPEEVVAGETRAFLAGRLSDGKSHERAWAALAIGVLERERGSPKEMNAASTRALMLAALKDCGSPDELGALAIGCGLVGDVDAVPVLIAKMERASDPRVLGHTAIALGLLGDARATKALKTVLDDSRFRPELLRSAAIGLALLEDRSLVPTLIETLSRATSLASQSAAASVIGWIGDRRAVDPLLALMSNRDATASARGYAVVALGRVCDRDRVPWNARVAENVHYRAATATLVGGDGTGLLEIY